MTKFWKSGLKDTAKNGAFVGGIMGLFIVIGDKVVATVENIIPINWLILNDLSVSVYIILAGIVLGYIIDKW